MIQCIGCWLDIEMRISFKNEGRWQLEAVMFKQTKWLEKLTLKSSVIFRRCSYGVLIKQVI